MKFSTQSLFSILRGLVVMVFVLGLATEMQAQKRWRVGYKDRGFSPIVEGAVLIPSNTYDLAFNIDAIFGVCAGPWYVGGGVGLDSYESDLFTSVFADARYCFVLGDIIFPFAFLDAGYAIPVDVDPLLSGGPMINPGAGLKIFLSRSFAVNLSLGYRFQSMPLTENDPTTSTTTRTNWIQSPNFRLGIQF
ncbi:MAG: hypothetical protein AAGN35_09605 [Bacteroidota bacterium]